MTTTFDNEKSSLIKCFVSCETKQAMINDYIASFDDTVMNKDFAQRMEKFLTENSHAIAHMRNNLITSMSDFIHVNNFDVEQHECVSRTQIQELITLAVMLTNILNLQLGRTLSPGRFAVMSHAIASMLGQYNPQIAAMVAGEE